MSIINAPQSSKDCLDLLRKNALPESDQTLFQCRYNGAEKQYKVGLIEFPEFDRFCKGLLKQIEEALPKPTKPVNVSDDRTWLNKP